MKIMLQLMVLLFFSISIFAQEIEGDQNLEKQIQNPVASLIRLPFLNNKAFDVGPYNHTRNTLNKQPVRAFSFGEKLNLITRTIIPMVSQPLEENDSEFGGDSQFRFQFV